MGEEALFQTRVREVVTCFFRHRERILALKRSGKVRAHRGKWAGVSGTVEASTPLQQAYKEILEETGLAPSQVRFLRQGGPMEISDPENQVV